MMNLIYSKERGVGRVNCVSKGVAFLPNTSKRREMIYLIHMGFNVVVSKVWWMKMDICT